MTDFKIVLKFIIDECKNMDSISPNFDYSELDQVKVQAFVPVEEEELPEIIYENRNYQEVLQKIKQVETIYIKRDTQQIRVYKCLLEETGEVFALKEITANREQDLESFKQEAYYLENLSNSGENFLKFYAARYSLTKVGSQEKHKFEILMEYVGRDLKALKLERIQAGNPFNEDEIKFIYEQLISAFNILRGKNILHCDIKPTNILVTDDLKLKIIDFGIARTGISDTTHATGAFGTKDFMAPEIKQAIGGRASLKSDKADVYSLGMTLLYLLVNDFPQDLNSSERQKDLQSLIESVPFKWIQDPLKKMLTFDYKMRADFKTLASIFAAHGTKGKTMTL
jgi:serine/threonine protein kinase